MEISGKNIIITGGLGCLGSSIAALMKENGANVIVFDRADSTANSSAVSGMADVHKIDVTNMEEVRKKLEEIDRVDALINCAGKIHSEPIINMLKKEIHGRDSWDHVINSNLNSCFVMTACVTEKMVSMRTKGVIINFSSISAKGNTGQAAYSAAKAGIEAFTKTAAKELGMFKIRVCAVAPGFIETQSTHEALSESMVSYWKKQIPLRRLGSLENIAATVRYIIENDYLSGEVIHVDGGLTI